VRLELETIRRADCGVFDRLNGVASSTVTSVLLANSCGRAPAVGSERDAAAHAVAAVPTAPTQDGRRRGAFTARSASARIVGVCMPSCLRTTPPQRAGPTVSSPRTSGR
jgi:hypothetical protein